MVNGLTTLRGYRKFDYFKIQFNDALHKSANATFGFLVSSRWLAIRLDLICALFAFLTAVLAFALKDQFQKEMLVASL